MFRKLTIYITFGVLLVSLLVTGCAESITSIAEENQKKIEELEYKVATQAEVIADMTVSRVTDMDLTSSYFKVNIAGEGEYPVILNLYGDGLQAGKVVSNKDNAAIVQEYYFNPHHLIVIVAPISRWLVADTIEVRLTGLIDDGGIVYFATADVGRKN